MTVIDLTSAVNDGDFYWWVTPTIWIHKGVIHIRGAIGPSNDPAQVIMPAGGIPAALRPTTPQSVTLRADVADSFPNSYAGAFAPHVTPLSYAVLDVARDSTVSPDGSWTLDSPVAGQQYRDLVLMLTADWDVGPVADVPSGWLPLVVYPSMWTNIDAEYAVHSDTVHLRGSIQIIDDLNSTFANITNGGTLPERVFGDTMAEADTDGHDEPVELYIGDWDGHSSYMALANAARVPTSLVSGTIKVPGGVFTRDYPGETFTSLSDFPPDLSGTDWDGVRSYPHFTFDDPPQLLWRTPWWTWHVTVGDLTGFAPGPIAAIPAIPSVDLGAAVAAFEWPPDWVTIQFHCDMSLAYTGYATLADAQADAAGDPSGQVPVAPYSHAQLSAARAAVTPYVNGVSNRKFVTAGDYDASPGAFAGPAFHGFASFDSYMFTDAFTADCYLAPIATSYTQRKIVEPAGMEHAQLLWRPDELGIASVSVFGEAQATNMNCRWRVTPFWELPHDYLLAGDTITFTQRSWYPTPVTGPIPGDIHPGDMVSGVVRRLNNVIGRERN